jgi:ATP-binding cassette subfamily B protein
MFRKKHHRPAGSGPRPASAASILKRIVKELGPRGSLAALLAATMLAGQAAAQTVPPLVLRRLLNAIPRHDLRTVYTSAAGLIGLALVVAVVSQIHRVVAARVGYGLLGRLQTELFDHLQRQPIGFFTGTPSNTIHAAVSDTFTALRSKAVRGVSWVLYLLFILVGAGVTLIVLDRELALIACATVPVIVGWCLLVGRRGARIVEAGLAAEARLATIAREALSLSGVVAVKTLRDRMLRDRFRDEAATIVRSATRQDAQVRTALFPIDLIAALLTVGVFVRVALNAIGGRPTPSLGTLVVFSAALGTFLYTLRGLIDRLFDLDSVLRRFASSSACWTSTPTACPSATRQPASRPATWSSTTCRSATPITSRGSSAM